MKKILLIDNYDSFTYNLVHYLQEFNASVTVIRNDVVTTTHCDLYDAIVLSPGPGIPQEAGNLMAIIDYIKSKKPILGICLGHQALTLAYGGDIINLNKVYHGISTNMTHNYDALFKEIPQSFVAGRYHSWVSDKKRFPEELLITATDENNEVMAFKHKGLPIYGVQFHPESIMTIHGKKMIANFLDLI